MSTSLPVIDIVYIDAGGGHKTAATVLKEQLESYGTFKVTLVNLRDVLDSVDPIKNWFGISVESFYNKYCSLGYTIASGPMLRTSQFILRRIHKKLVSAVANYWHGRDIAMVVSVIPNFNKALFEGIKQIKDTPYVTIMTDLADLPPHFWMEEQDQYFICGSKKALQQAEELGLNKEKLYLVSGMIVAPAFYQTPPSTLVYKGFSKEKLVGLVSYGAAGSHKIFSLAKAIESSKLKDELQMIYVCGKDEGLLRKMQNTSWSYPVLSVGFTKMLPTLMDASNFFIGKPGPGSISEAIVKKLPVLLDRGMTMIQERYNVEWVQEQKFGDVFRVGDMDKMADFICHLAIYKEAIANYSNTAIQSIPSILNFILESERKV